MDDAIRSGLVGEGRPVLGHDDACRTVVTMQLDEQVGQALRFDGPGHRCGLHARREDRPCSERAGQLVGAWFGTRLGGDRVSAVVVDSQEVERTGDDLQVAIADEPHVAHRPVVLDQLGRIPPAKERIQELSVHVQIREPRRPHVARAVRGREGGLEVQRDADLAVTPHRLAGQAVSEQQVMRGGERQRVVGSTGRVDPRAVPEPGGHPGLVQGDPGMHVVPERAVDDRRVLGEPRGRVAVPPTALVLQRLRQVPVIERRQRGDAVAVQRVHQPAVVVEARLVRRPPPFGLDPGPRHRESVRPHPQAGHERHVLLVPVVLVARDVPGVPVTDRAGDPAERVPDGGAASVLVHRPLDLVGGRGDAPQEPFGKRVDRRGALGQFPSPP